MAKTQLVPNAIKFCGHIARGHRQADSYQQAYGCMNRGSARAMSSRLMKDPRIIQRIVIERDRIYKVLDGQSEKLIKDFSKKQQEVSIIVERQKTALTANRRLFERSLIEQKAVNPNLAIRAQTAEYKEQTKKTATAWDYSLDARGRPLSERKARKPIKAKIGWNVFK